MSRALAIACALAVAACGRVGFHADGGDGAVATDGSSAFPADWWDTSFAYRSRIDIHGSLLDTGVTDFPLYVRLSASVVDLQAIDPAGADLRVLAADQKTELDYEIESVDETGFDLWIHVPVIRGRTVDDVAYVYYGNPGAAAPLRGEAVWDTSYVGVWHLATGRDATSHHLDGEYSGTLPVAGLTHAARQMQVGTVHGYLRVPYVQTFDSFAADGNGTWSGWIAAAGPSADFQSIIEREIGNTTSDLWRIGLQTTLAPAGNLVDSTGDGASVAGANPEPAAMWSQIAMTWSSGEVALWSNGEIVATTALPQALQLDTTDLFFGAGCAQCNNVPNGDFVNGSVDEVRLENTPRDHAWFAAQIANMNGALVTVTRADP